MIAMGVKATVTLQPVSVSSPVQTQTVSVKNSLSGSSVQAAKVSAQLTAQTVTVKDNVNESSLTSGKAMVRMPSKAYFPSLGDDGCLYVDESEERVYLWQADSLTYKPIASDWHQIGVINGGNA